MVQIIIIIIIICILFLSFLFLILSDPCAALTCEFSGCGISKVFIQGKNYKCTFYQSLFDMSSTSKCDVTMLGHAKTP